jgi:hypothetical protein
LPVRQVRVKISDNGLKILLWYSSKLNISVFKGSEINMSSILKMEALCSPKMLALSQGAARCNNPEGLHLHSHCCENLKSYEIKFLRIVSNLEDAEQRGKCETAGCLV